MRLGSGRWIRGLGEILQVQKTGVHLFMCGCAIGLVRSFRLAPMWAVGESFGKRWLFPMVTATAYIGVWRRGRTHASARPTTHCGEPLCQTCGPPTCITCNGPYLGVDVHRLRASHWGRAEIVEGLLQRTHTDPHDQDRTTRTWLSTCLLHTSPSPRH
mgnify:CR=1 FL=1